MFSDEKTWDTIAISFDKTRKKPWKDCLDYINQLNKNSISLDLACGNGRHLLSLSRKSKITIGLDFSKKMLKIIEKKIEIEKINNITLIHGNAVEIPLKNKTIDSILYIAALHNIRYKKNRIKSLKEVKRILKKDGTALISVWSKNQKRFNNNLFEKNYLNTEPGDIILYWKQDKHNVPRFYHLYSKEEFIDDLTKGGLEVINFKESKIASKNYPDNFFALVK